LLSAGLISGGSSIIGGLLGSSAASKAAKQQQAAVGAANTELGNASTLAGQTATQTLNNQTSALSPYIQAGNVGLNGLTSALSPGGSLATAPTLNLGQFSFDPTNLDQTPGYQFQLGQGENAIKNNAAATGTLGGNAAESLDNYSQGLAGSTYNNAFSQALSAYGANTNSQVQNYNAALGGQNSIYSRLSGLAGIGQNATNTDVSAQGAYGQNVTANQLGTASQISQNLIGGGNAAAAGTVGAANAWSNALGSLGSTASQFGALSAANSSYNKAGAAGAPDQLPYTL